MKKLSIFFIVFAVSAVASIASAATIRIDGYSSGEFAVKEDIKNQLEQKVVTPLRAELENAKKNNKDKSSVSIFINVVGYADKSGDGPANDHLAQDRADAVSRELKRIFPGVEPNSLSRGNEVNVRMVTVQWEITTRVAEDRTGLYVLIGLSTVIGGVIGLMIRRRHLLKKKIAEDAASAAMMRSVLQQELGRAPETKTAVMEVDGMAYSVPMSFVDGYWITPFEGVVRQEWKKAVATVKGRLQDRLRYGNDIDKAIAAGKIEVKPIREEASHV